MTTSTETKINLGLYDFEILIDRSGSMDEADCPGGATRFAYAEEQAIAVARECSKYDSDGITVVPYNAKWKVYENTTEASVKTVFAENTPNGSTATGAVLEDRLFGPSGYFTRKKANSAKNEATKPLILVVFTDGVPDDQGHVERVLINASKQIDSDEELGISFMQVGKDAKAHSWLKVLDEGLEAKGAKFDIVNVKTYEELNDISIHEALIAALTD